MVLKDTEKFPYSVTALDADGNATTELAAGSTFAVTSSDDASASVVPDNPPAAGTIASGFVLGGSKLATGVQINAVETKADGTPGISGQLLVDVVASAAASLSIAAGAAVPQ